MRPIDDMQRQAVDLLVKMRYNAFEWSYANIREANYGQSKADMLSKFEIALKECSETEGWLQLLFNTQIINEQTFKSHRNLCGRIRRMLIASCKTLKENVK